MPFEVVTELQTKIQRLPISSMNLTVWRVVPTLEILPVVGQRRSYFLKHKPRAMGWPYLPNFIDIGQPFPLHYIKQRTNKPVCIETEKLRIKGRSNSTK